MIHRTPKFHLINPSTAFRRHYKTSSQWLPLQTLPNNTLDTFRAQAFDPAKPALLPRGTFVSLPAIDRWFVRQPNSPTSSLNHNYLDQHGSAIVPLELTSPPNFHRAEAPLSIFLEWTKSATFDIASRLYLAQAPLSALPSILQADLPTPNIVLEAGKGDIYDANLWMGIPPTYTPLHRDPNPNLFVQLAGRKLVRLMEPGLGDEVFRKVQRDLGREEKKAFRGEEMMGGEERRMLEEVVWGKRGEEGGFEAELERGDGVFIPNGWWHSIKGVGEGVTGSVNWWFR